MRLKAKSYQSIDHLVYVVPELYGQLPLRDRYDVANVIGKINFALKSGAGKTSMYLGPGRWGTSSPELGIPVTFAQINHAAVICEIVAMREDLIPDVSLGTHFLNELVEMNMLYLALFPEHQGNYINKGAFEAAENLLVKTLSGSDKWRDMIKIISAKELAPEGCELYLQANARAQEVDCYFKASC